MSSFGRTSEFVTVFGHWYHNCPVTGQMRRIGHNINIVVDGKCPPYETCYLCGKKNPAAKKSKILRNLRKSK